MSQSKLPEDHNTADTTTWRYVGHLLPAMPSDGSPLLVDVIERTCSPDNRLVRSDTQYNGDGTFYSIQGKAVYWSYQRPMPAEYLTEAEASVDLDVCGYAGKWKSAKLSTIAPPEVAEADYWLAVRLCFLELGGSYPVERPEPEPARPLTSLERRIAIQQAAIGASRNNYTGPQKVRQG